MSGKPRTALILTGHSTKSVYAAGGLKALIDKYQFISPDIVIASSGSAGTAAYFTAGQFKEIKKVWFNYVCTKEFINIFRFRRIMNVDYLVDIVAKTEVPLDSKKVYSSEISLYIPVLDSENGNVVYFSNKDGVSIFELLRAAKAQPVIYGKTVEINGNKYCDSISSNSLKLHIKKALELGAEKIIVIKSDKQNLRWEILSLFFIFAYKLWVQKHSKKFRSNYSLNFKLASAVSEDVELMVLGPKKNINFGLTVNNRSKLAETFEQGYRETLEDKNLENFMKFGKSLGALTKKESSLQKGKNTLVNYRTLMPKIKAKSFKK